MLVASRNPVSPEHSVPPAAAPSHVLLTSTRTPTRETSSMQRVFALLFASLALALGSFDARAASGTDQRLDDARQVFESFSNLTEQTIPSWLLERAYGIVVAPNVIKLALGIGGRGGRGVMAVRNPDGTWSNPVFVTLAGGNIGFQIGVQSTDLVLVLMSRKSVEGIAGGKVTLGADASVAAGD